MLTKAILKKASILILDESTASIDYNMDTAIQDVLKREFCDATVFTIAHRIETIINSDKIIGKIFLNIFIFIPNVSFIFNILTVMPNGSIIEIGAPDELLNQKNSEFRKLAQFSL